MHVVWNCAWSAVVIERAGSASGLGNGFFGAFSAGGSANGGLFALKSKKSNMLCALASRKVSAGRFHLVSTNLRIDVWS